VGAPRIAYPRSTKRIRSLSTPCDPIFPSPLALVRRTARTRRAAFERKFLRNAPNSLGTPSSQVEKALAGRVLVSIGCSPAGLHRADDVLKIAVPLVAALLRQSKFLDQLSSEIDLRGALDRLVLLPAAHNHVRVRPRTDRNVQRDDCRFSTASIWVWVAVPIHRDRGCRLAAT
jgi:hypothetical protein